MTSSTSRNPEDKHSLVVYWGGPALVNRYDPALLRDIDLPRASATRSSVAEGEWRASRALMQRLPAHPLSTSLSHKLGHVVLACAPAGWQVGVDLEQLRPRDTLRLADWMASPLEIAALADMPPDAALRHFYRLWTVKEAMIKARGLDFPADMKRNTLVQDRATGSWRLDADGQEDWSVRVFEAEPGWVLAVVWRAPEGRQADIDWEIVSDAPEGSFQLAVSGDD